MGTSPTQKAIIGQFINGRNATDDFLQLATNHGGTVFGWIDSDGKLQGTLANSVVASLNGLTGAITLAAGPNITITPSGNTLTITSTGVATPGGLDTDVQFNDGGTLFGNGDFTYNKSTKVVASTVFNAVTGFQIGGAAASGKFLRGNGTNFVSSGIQTGDVTWDQIGNAAGSLTLANGTNATTFNQTSAVSWTWANATAATGGANQLSPVLTIAGTYWTGAVSAVDSWTIQNVLGSGSNPTTSLTFAHSGSGTAVSITVPNQITISNVGSVSAVLVLEGSSSGAAGWTVGGAAGSPHLLQMPSLDPVATGAVLQATVGNPTATSWTTTPTLSTLTITGATPTGSGTQLSFGNTTATSANAGSNGDVPAQVVGYIVLDLGGVKIKVPYYAT